ncbi:MAG: ImmA/IrrE family metallo-endopeptidase [Lachnospiraceae bacterium]|nr:ImmA/IrrE family metallo-endopeptidase [Lachnospiraceae bacterium]
MKLTYERYEEIAQCAENCYKRFKTRNALQIFNYLNIDYSFINLKGKIGGFTHKEENYKRKFCVYINNKYDAYSRKIIAAHELGHILLHGNDDLNIFSEEISTEIPEYEANLFALIFMPHIQPQNISLRELSITELQKYICSKLYLSNEK